jgi:hypothetical protein
MLFHAGLDPALAGRNLTAEARNIGLACSENRLRAGPHLRHRSRSREQEDGARNQNFPLQHNLFSPEVACVAVDTLIALLVEAYDNLFLPKLQ